MLSLFHSRLFSTSPCRLYHYTFRVTGNSFGTFKSLHAKRMATVAQPEWKLPTSKVEEPVLKVYNSLTRTKTEFVAANGRHVKWYNCGPTVYDASHMGHARNYVTQDILRRILSDYFGYDVHFVMNITDIDDKIILRARQTHLVEQFKTSQTALTPELIAIVTDSWTSYVYSKVSKGLSETDKLAQGQEWSAWQTLQGKFGSDDKTWKQENLRRDEKFEMHFSAANKAYTALQNAWSGLEQGRTSQEEAQALVEESRDILALTLDAKDGHTITDPTIFRSLSSYWEQQFFNDMRRLRVLDPDTLTRVTEYVPEIVDFVQGIVKNGYGYEVDGSVYFDTRTFDKNPHHDYAKLEPWSKGNNELLAEGEGALSVGSGRRSPADFALWKASKPGEPSWDSPWGPGRPGWHIECSVMASAVFGENMDIHSGGVDLAFPHHDNEMAQSEAYHECGRWVNYFLHTGHLHIEGLKMSKSLKNFITIDEILQRYTARQMRLAFLTQLWNAKIDFSESLMTGEVKNLEATLNNFFRTAKALIRQHQSEGPRNETKHRYGDAEKELTEPFHQAQSAFRTALCDSFNTPAALDVIRDVVSRTNVYINSRSINTNLDVTVVERIAKWVGGMLRMFGLGEGESSEIGWGQVISEGEGNNVNREDTLMPYLRSLSSFRDGVRKVAIDAAKGGEKGDEALKEILALCDRLRDVDLVPLGVALDDQEDGRALVKLLSPAELIKARDEKKAQEQAKIARKAAAAEAERQKKLAKLEKGRVAPRDLFKPPNVPEGAYGSWNVDGLPLTDGEGKELSKNAVKKVTKEWQTQKKAHEEFLAWQKEQAQS
ncbi:tRNA synthetases class I (C) catalytic domain-containing protein [Irpex rosettiformis]|uniref:tRNA synthetases class I (C) catalytic domain-containing protein n=1 Tax=Irpex rosettiformis TaxID=378272 RepID=A0ACB8U266_9APHY|nr:tRNA synthetases class I (C) catalytic domain-containing protein [Irpex rosettiformis]